METISQREVKEPMAKIVLFSLKALLMLSTTWLVVPLAEMSDQFATDQPPLIMFWTFCLLLFSHELLFFVFTDIRKVVLKSFETPDGRTDAKQLVATYFSLTCIRLFGFGKLNEIYFERGFDDKTYYYLIVIILILVGGVVIDKSISTILRKVFDK